MILKTKTIFSLTIVVLFTICAPFIQSTVAQTRTKTQEPPRQFVVAAKDMAFRVIGVENSEWTAYKKKKVNDAYFKFLDSAKAFVTIRVAMKNYNFDDRKKLTTYVTVPAEFLFEAEEDLKLRIQIDPFVLPGDTLLTKLEVKKDVPTYLEVTGRITKPRLGAVQVNAREKRKTLYLSLAEPKVVQSKDLSETPYYWRKNGKVIDRLAETIEARKFSDGFDLSGMGFRKVGE
ncbi:MAG: hypothetical protein KGZ58_08980 [Ignavibacteriales bacterium]|nr:hypothetical protein [Ignavibacteriales bacterium]